MKKQFVMMIGLLMAAVTAMAINYPTYKAPKHQVYGNTSNTSNNGSTDKNNGTYGGYSTTTSGGVTTYGEGSAIAASGPRRAQWNGVGVPNEGDTYTDDQGNTYYWYNGMWNDEPHLIDPGNPMPVGSPLVLLLFAAMAAAVVAWRRRKCALPLMLGIAFSLSAQATDQSRLVSGVTHVQPGCGLVLWPDNAEDLKATYGSAISLEFQYCLPCKVVTGKKDGVVQYNWKWLDDILNDVAGRGHQAVIRFRYEYPSGTDVDGKKGTTAVPAYIKQLPGYTETYKKVSGDGPTYYADWSNSELQWFTKQFYTDLQARYGNDPRIAFLEVGFGHWSEYHIYGSKTQFGVNFPTKQYQSEFFQHLDTTMTIPWLVSIDAADDEYSPLQDDAAMRACTFGLFDDSFMHSEHDFSQGEGWNEQCWQWAGTDRWKTGVCGGEISYYTDNDQKNFLNPAGMYGVTWEQAAAKYHITFMNTNDAPEGSYGTPERFRSAGMAVGYRFKVLSASVSSDRTELTVTNTGVAPIYRDAFFAIGTTRSETSLQGLLPGEQRSVVIMTPLNNAADLKVVSDYILSSQQIQYDADCAIVQVSTDLYEYHQQVLTTKTLQNGKILLRRGDAVYDLMGRRLVQ